MPPNQQGQFTWADVKTQIAFRLNRSNLDPSYIQLMAEERADMIASESWYPSQQTNTDITTEFGQYMYLLPKGTVNILMVRFLLTQVWIPLTRARRYEDILLADPVQPPFTAIPSTARAFGRLLRLFPTPNGQYPLELSLERRIDIPTDDQDAESFWVNEGRAWIINRTAEHIAREYLRDPDRANNHKMAADDAEDKLTEITHARNGPHIMEPHN
jgi:hypothetical protein